MCKKTIEEQVWSRGRPFTPLLAFLLHSNTFNTIQSPFPPSGPPAFSARGAKRGRSWFQSTPPPSRPVAPAIPLRTIQCNISNKVFSFCRCKSKINLVLFLGRIRLRIQNSGYPVNMNLFFCFVPLPPPPLSPLIH